MDKVSDSGWSWMIYGWFMGDLWMTYGWFMDDLWLCCQITWSKPSVRNARIIPIGVHYSGFFLFGQYPLQMEHWKVLPLRNWDSYVNIYTVYIYKYITDRYWISFFFLTIRYFRMERFIITYPRSILRRPFRSIHLFGEEPIVDDQYS